MKQPTEAMAGAMPRHIVTVTRSKSLGTPVAAQEPTVKRKARPTPAESAKHADDEAILAHVTKSATVAAEGMQTLRLALVAACESDLDRDDVIQAVIEGGWSESRARGIVSEIWTAAGKRERKEGAGRKASPEAEALAEYAVTEYGDKAANYLRAAARILAQNKESAAK